MFLGQNYNSYINLIMFSNPYNLTYTIFVVNITRVIYVRINIPSSNNNIMLNKYKGYKS